MKALYSEQNIVTEMGDEFYACYCKYQSHYDYNILYYIAHLFYKLLYYFY